MPEVEPILFRNQRLRIFIFIALVSVGKLAQGEEQPLNVTGNFTWLNAVSYTALQETPLNPGNTILQAPKASFLSELRPNLKLVSAQLQIIARPRVKYSLFRTEIAEDLKAERSKTKSQWQEVYAQWTLSDSFLFAFGRQNFQWGPAESLSPSNRIFHETTQVKNILYETMGKHLARVNISLGKDFSSVIMLETEPNKDEQPFQAEEEFSSAALIKNEINWNSGADYLGVVVGGRESGRSWVGEYLSLTMPYFDAISLYADASHERGSAAWYPDSETIPGPIPSSAVAFNKAKQNETKIYTLSVTGLKYAFENGSEARFEYIFNQAGWSKAEFDLAMDSFLSPNPVPAKQFAHSLAAMQSPGLELLTQRYSFVSVSVPDFFTVSDLILFLRYLQAVDDVSSSTYGSLEYRFKTAGNLFLATTYNHGDKSRELARYTKSSSILGYSYAW